MPRKPVHSIPVPLKDRVRQTRARRRAEGLPSLDVARRLLVEQMADLPPAQRAQLVDAACAALPPDQRAGSRLVMAKLLNLPDQPEERQV
ncbi:hypothetical protein FBY14_12456 [Azospirillum brasilense]|nr:hypothetical protein FBY14_12456 [Azospirillum brasilense]